MAIIGYKSFTGCRPKVEPHLLPDTAAQYAAGCVFDSGALHAAREGEELFTMVNNPIRGIYTDDAINFFTWTVETQAFKSPVIDDPYLRVYYLQPSVGTLYATQSIQMANNGPSPTTSWKVGVPAPAVAPILTLVDRTTLPDYPNVSLSAEAWWYDGSIEYQRGAVTLTEITPFVQYDFTPPPMEDGTPEGATLGCRLVLTNVDDGKRLAAFTLSVANSAISDAFPGTVEVSLTAEGTIDIVWGAEETRAYTYVNQNDWDEESSNAPPAIISPTYLQDVQIEVTPTSFTGYRPFARYNVYRTYGTGGVYLKTEVTGSGVTYVDASRSPSAIGSSLESASWLPPVAGLQGAVLAPGGWFAAFKGNTLYMTEPYRPHAWAYSQTFSRAIRGICAVSNALVVTTADGVHMLNGQTPAAAAPQLINLPQAGIAQRSMIGLDGDMAYASRDGIVLVAGSTATLTASQRLFTREKWQELYGDILQDASIRFAFHDGMLVASSHTQAKGFVVRMDEEAGSFTHMVERFDATFQLPVADALFYSIDNKIYQFRSASEYQLMDWWGKDFIFKRDVNFGCGMLAGDEAISLKLYGDGVEKFCGTIEPGHFRLPSMNVCRRWSVRIRGGRKVSELYLARDMRELRNV